MPQGPEDRAREIIDRMLEQAGWGNVNFKVRPGVALLLFQNPLHPANWAAHFMTGMEPVNHKSCMRVRSVSAHGRLYCQVKENTPWHVCAAL